ncbi:DNAJ protein [Atractiella rhizophila]|nr:DNAJ protein [Atractiella rhizophila]
MRIRMSGQGDAPISGKGKSGDLFIRISVQPSTDFRRQGSNVYHDISVPFHVALLGGTVKIPTLEQGQEALKIPAGTQPGQEITLAGRGIKHLRASRKGDYIATVRITLPRLVLLILHSSRIDGIYAGR